jgi:hypothetical protein
VKFFIPSVDDLLEAEKVWRSFADDCGAPQSCRRLYSLTYTHDQDKIVVTVGKPPMVYKRQTGPRGGYIKNADFVRLGQSIGTTVCGIVDAGSLIYVYQIPSNRYWANPILVGQGSVMTLDPFEEEIGKTAEAPATQS